MSLSNHTPSRWRRWLSRTAGVLLLIAAVLFCAYKYYTSPKRIAAMASDVLAAMSGAEVEISSGRFDLDGRIELEQVRLKAPGLPEVWSEIFSGRRIQIHIDPMSLIFGPLRLREIHLEEPVFSMTELADGGFAFQRLYPAEIPVVDPDVPAVSGSPWELPHVTITGGLLRCVDEVLPGEYRVISELPIAGSLDAIPDLPHQYQFSLHQERASGSEEPIQINGTLDQVAGRLEARLSRLLLDGPQRQMLPRQVRQWWAAHHPGGALEDITFRYDPETGPVVEGRVQGGMLTLPEISRGEYTVQMTEVAGTFGFDPQRIRVEGLRGQIEGLRYRIDGEFDGYDPQAPFRMSLVTDPFEIRENLLQRLVLGSAIHQAFDKFSPEGRLRAAATVWRGHRGGGFEYEGAMELLEAKVLFEDFPYPLHAVNGTLAFSSRTGLEIEASGAGVAEGSRISLSGVIGAVASNNGSPAIDMTIRVTDVAYDPAIYRAVGSQGQKILDDLFDRKAQEHLLALQQQGKLPADVSLNLEGRLDVEVRLVRRDAPGTALDVRTVLNVREARMLYTDFPYPLHVHAGKIHISGQRTRLEGFSGEGPGGGRVELQGKSAWGDEPDAGLYLQLQGRNLPVDGWLFEAVGPASSKWMRENNVSGRFDLNGDIHNRHDTGLEMSLDIDLHDGALEPNAGRFAIDHVSGRMHLGVGRLDLVRIAGQRGGAEIEVSGEVDWSNRDAAPGARLDIRAKNLMLEESLLDLNDANIVNDLEIRKAWARFEPAGRVDAHLKYFQGPEKDGFRLELRPQWLAANLKEGRLRVTQAQGLIVVEPGQVQLQQVSGELPEKTRVQLDGVLRPPASGSDEQWSIDLKIQARGTHLEDTARRLLPDDVSRPLEVMEIDGAFDLEIPVLVWNPQADPKLQVNAWVRWEGAGARAGLPVRDFHGVMNLTALTAAGQSSPRLDAEIHADRLMVADWQANHVQAQLRQAADSSLLMAELLTGNHEDGFITGSGSVDFEKSRFDMRLSMMDADLERMMRRNASKKESKKAGAETEKLPQGRVSITAHLAGSLEDRSALRGGGAILVRDGDLYGVPLMIGLVKIMHLNLPVADPFDQAVIAFDLENRVVRISQVELSAPGIRLSGEGSYHLDSGEMDMVLTTRSPGALRLGPFSDLVDILRDELIAVRVSGLLSDPKVFLQQLSKVGRVWQDLTRPPPAP